MNKFVPALILAAACLSTGWWLLREAPERERLPASMPGQSAASPAGTAEPRATAAARDDELSTYFASKSELGRNFAQPSMVCRSRSCEVQAIGYGPRAFDTWEAATQDLRDQPWREDMRAGGIYTIERAPNEHAVVLILIRRCGFRAKARASSLPRRRGTDVCRVDLVGTSGYGHGCVSLGEGWGVNPGRA